MNKYTKNQIWFNLEKLICLTVVSAFVILMVACITSCSTTTKLSSNYNQQVGCYDFKNTK